MVERMRLSGLVCSMSEELVVLIVELVLGILRLIAAN
jgi:hypothetical protein